MTKEEWRIYRQENAAALAYSQRKYYESHKEAYKAKCKEYARKRRLKLGMKPRGEKKKACDSCMHFIHREVGIRGGIKGVCELSKADAYYFNEYQIRRGIKPICKKFEGTDGTDGKG